MATLEDAIKMREKFAAQQSFEIPDADMQSFRDSIVDPTGLMPFMKEQINVFDDLSHQVEFLQISLQEQIKKFDNYKSAQETKQANDDAQRILDA